MRPKTFTKAALDALQAYSFPGNVRELRNLVERLLIMTRGTSIGADEIRALLPRGAAPSPERLSEAVDAFERARIQEALEAEAGSMTRAAARLGIERSHLYKKMKKLGLTA